MNGPEPMAEGSRLPDFLIAGAAKCGTTSLYRYLSPHPEIFMPGRKEPKFLTSSFLEFPHRGPGDDRVDRYVVREESAYRALFQEATEEEVVGEASADTLFYHERSIPRIRAILGKPRIVILVRDPVERAFSAWLHMRRAGREPLEFAEALDREAARRSDNWEFIWFYRALGHYHPQVDAFLQAFDHVHVTVFERLVTEPEAEVSRILRFLGVDEHADLPGLGKAYNVSRIPRNPFVSAVVEGEPGIAGGLRGAARRLLPSGIRRSVHGALTRWNRVRPEMEEVVRMRLKDEFRESTMRLRETLDDPLPEWGGST